MSRKQLLQLVEDKGFAPVPRRTIHEAPGLQEGALHSLHSGVQYPWGIRPEFADFCLRRYSGAGDVVYDPFCGRGAVPLQAALLGRVAVGADENPLSVLVSEAKLFPAGLDEVVLGLHLIPFSRPTEMKIYRETFFPFYHPDTFRELVNLREHLSSKDDRLSRFIALLALSRLHGHMPGHLSAYSAPQVSLTPERQIQLNLRRRESPEYRAVAPRLIRRAAQLLQDGVGSEFIEAGRSGAVRRCDPRRNAWLAADSVDCVITSFPQPRAVDPLDEHWLSAWFAGLGSRRSLFADLTVGQWQTEMRDVLGDLLRVAKPGASISVAIGDADIDGEIVALDESIAEIARRVERPGKAFRVEEVLVFPLAAAGAAGRGRTPTKQTRILTLRVVRKPR